MLVTGSTIDFCLLKYTTLRTYLHQDDSCDVLVLLCPASHEVQRDADAVVHDQRRIHDAVT